MKVEKISTYLDGELSLQEIQSLNFSEVKTVIEDDTAKLSGHFTNKGKLFLHMKVKGRFTKSMLKEWKYHFLDILDECKKVGLTAVYSTIPDEDSMAFKFNVAMGFAPVGTAINKGTQKIWVMRRGI